MPIPQLYDYQQDGVDKIREEYKRGNKRVVAVYPTGSGKTTMFSYMAQTAANRGRRTLICAHREELINQISETLDNFEVPHGIIAPGCSMSREPVQVGMIMSVARRLDKIPEPGLLIIDEAHRAVSKSYRTVLDAYSSAYHLLPTATPARTDGRGLEEIADAMVIGPSIRELKEWGKLTPYRLFAPQNDIDWGSIPKRGNDYDDKAQIRIMEETTIVGDAIANYKEKTPNMQFLVFCPGVEYSQRIAEQFRNSGVHCEAADGSMSKADRRDMIKRYRSGNLLGMASCDLFNEGLDIPSVRVGIFLRKTNSIIIYRQQNGRLFRLYPGKDFAYLFDHVGNSRPVALGGLGLPDDDIEWSLDGSKQAAKHSENDDGEATKRCDKCFMVFHAHLKVCPNCGNIPVASGREIKQVDGELVEIMRENQARQESLALLPMKQALEMCSTVEDIKEMAKLRKYKAGWIVRAIMSMQNVDAFSAAKLAGYNPQVVYKLGLHTSKAFA